MNSENELADLVERIHRVSRTAGSPNRAPAVAAPSDVAAPPGLPSVQPLTTPDPVPLAEVTNMIPRAREKVRAGAKAPGVLRPMFRNQGGINGIIVEACNRLVDVSQQLRAENNQLRARVEAITKYLAQQHGWLESFAHGTSLDRQTIHSIQVSQAAASTEELANRLASLEARESDQAEILGRLDAQTEHAQRWMQGLQAFADEQGLRDDRLQARLAGQLQESGQRPATEFSSEVKLAIDARLDSMGEHINSLQEQSHRHGARLDTAGDRLADLQGRSEVHAGRLDGLGGHLNSLQEQSHAQSVRLDGVGDRAEEAFVKAGAADAHAGEVHGHLDKLGQHLQGSLDGFGGRITEAEDKVKWSWEHVAALQAQSDGQGSHLAGLQAHADRLGVHLGDLQGHNDREEDRINTLQRRLDEALETCEHARADLAAATTTQRYLEESNRRLDERQINDASYLRAQLGFHQRLFSHWLAPTLIATSAAASPGDTNVGEGQSGSPLALGGTTENVSPDSAPAPAPDAGGTLLAASSAAGGNDANVIAKRKAAASFTQHEMDALYLAFEDAMRGNRADIKSRLREYLPYLQNARVGSPASPVLDLGCGRGEWLEILRENGMAASGVDLNAVMIEQCRARRLNATLVNALDHLATLGDASVGALTAFHLIEHLPFPVLVQFFNECRRVLQPGGIAIFETPNPTNVLVGSCFFWHDYTHQRPLPPLSTRFLVEHVGFAKVEILPLHPWSEEGMVQGDGTNPALVARFNELFYGPQDYAIMARVGGAGMIT